MGPRPAQVRVAGGRLPYPCLVAQGLQLPEPENLPAVF